MNRHLSDDDVMRALAGANPLPPRPARTRTDTIRREALPERITAAPPTGEPALPRRRLGARVAALLATTAIALAAAIGVASPATAEGILRETAAAVACSSAPATPLPSTPSSAEATTSTEVRWDHRLGRAIIIVDPGQGALLEVRDYELGSGDLIHRSTILEWGTLDDASDPEPPSLRAGLRFPTRRAERTRPRWTFSRGRSCRRSSLGERMSSISSS